MPQDEAGPSQAPPDVQVPGDSSSSSRAKPPPWTFKRIQLETWLLLDDPSSSLQAQVLSLIMMCIIVLSIAAYTVAANPEQAWWTDIWMNVTAGEVYTDSNHSPRPPDSYRSDDSTTRWQSTEVDENRSPFYAIETFCIMVFSLEYILRLVSSPAGPGLFAYIFNAANMIDLISILPWYLELILGGGGLGMLAVLRLIRLTRITRIFKMSKQFQGLLVLFTTLRKSAAALLMLFAFMAIFSIFFATIIFTAEGGDYDEYRQQYVREDGSTSPFESIPQSIWWTIVTMTTVGYGDQYPITVGGKWVAILTMFCGLVVLSLPITIIGANFDEEYRQVKKRNQEEAEERRKAEREKAAATMAASGRTLNRQKTGAEGSLVSPDTGHTPAGAPLKVDPIKLIQQRIHEAHYELTEKVEDLLVSTENRLRQEILEILRNHAEGLDQRPNPLEQLKTESKSQVE